MKTPNNSNHYQMIKAISRMWMEADDFFKDIEIFFSNYEIKFTLSDKIRPFIRKKE
jgi:hypothetical protein